MAVELTGPLPINRTLSQWPAVPGFWYSPPPPITSSAPSLFQSAHAAWSVCGRSIPSAPGTSANLNAPLLRYSTLLSPGYTVVKNKSSNPSLSKSPRVGEAYDSCHRNPAVLERS